MMKKVGGVTLEKYITSIKRYEVFQLIYYIVFGVLTLLHPKEMIPCFISWISLYYFVSGIFSLNRSIVFKKNEEIYEMSLIGGVIYLIISIVLYSCFRELFSLLPIILGLFIIMNLLIKNLYYKQFSHSGSKMSWLYMVIFIIGFISLFNPLKSSILGVQLFGVLLILLGMSDLIYYARKRLKKK